MNFASLSAGGRTKTEQQISGWHCCNYYRRGKLLRYN